MKHIITVANQKGGVAKTTTVANLGASLAALGYRVAIVDLDSQGALTATFGYSPYKVELSTTDLITDSSLVMSDVTLRCRERLVIAPASAELLSAEYKLLKQHDRTARLSGAIQRSMDNFDYIIIDTPPNLGLLTINALVAAKHLLIPVKTEYLAMRGVRPLLESVWLIRDKINPGLELLGVLPTLYQSNSSHASAVIEEMRGVFNEKLFDVVIPIDEVAAVAPATRRAALDYKPNSAVAAAYRRLAEEVSYELG